MSEQIKFSSGRAQNEGRSLYFETWGSDSPTVLIEVGSTMAGTNDPGWLPIRAALAPTMRMIFYDRANLGKSDLAAQPRSIASFCADLHAVLSAAQSEPPVILVGCSFGGMICAYYGAAYPESIGGILLLDPPHPEINQRVLAMLPPETAQDSQALREFHRLHYQELYDPLAVGELETLDLLETAQLMRQNRSLGSIPLMVLTAGLDEWEEGFPEEIAQKYDQLWLEVQREYAALSTRSTHIIVEDSDHVIHNHKPQLVIQKIIELAEL